MNSGNANKRSVPDETGARSVHAVRQARASYVEAALVRAVVQGRCRIIRGRYLQPDAIP